MRFTGDSWTDGFDLAAPRQLYDSALTGVTMAGTLKRSLRLFVTFDSEISGPLNMWTGNAGIVKSW